MINDIGQPQAPPPPPLPQFVDPVLEIAGKLLIAIGIIFATTPIWSYFAAIAVPTPFIIGINGVVFCILGIRLLLNNALPPQPPNPRPRSASTADLGRRPSLPPELPRVKSAENLRTSTTSSDDQTLQSLPPNPQVGKILKENQKKAQTQIGQEASNPLYESKAENWSSTVETSDISKVGTIPMGIATIQAKEPFGLLGEAHICREIEFKNSLSSKDKTEQTYNGIVLAVLSGNNGATNFVEQFLTPHLIRLLENTPLSQDGIFSALNNLFKQLNFSCGQQRIEGKVSPAIVLILGRRVWVANSGYNRVFFVSNDLISEISQTTLKATFQEVEDTEEQENDIFQEIEEERDQTFVEGPQRNTLLPTGLTFIEDPASLAEAATVVPKPAITSMKLADEGFLVIGSRGFQQPYAPWCKVAQQISENPADTERELAKKLAISAAEAGSPFNVTAIVAKINSDTLSAVAPSMNKDPVTPEQI